MTPIQILYEMMFEDARRKHPEVPEYAIPKVTYKVKTANGLTKAIIKWIELNGGQAERINTMGRRIDTRKDYGTATGFRQQVGSVKWVPGTGTRGSADISSVINGKSVKIEVKVGKDRQSSAQKDYQAKIEKAGGVYVIARTFDGFYEWYKGFTQG